MEITHNLKLTETEAPVATIGSEASGGATTARGRSSELNNKITRGSKLLLLRCKEKQ